jgi:drug/metabolite transporter (DMT)-like permease
MSPFVVALGAHWFIPGERLRTQQGLGLLCAFAGMALALGDALRFPSYRELIGDGMALVAAVLWGATTVIVKATRLRLLGAHKTLFYQLAVSALLLPPLSLAMGEPGITRPTPLVLGMLAYQVLVVAFTTYLIWFWLISRYPAGRLSSFSFLTPLFGLMAGGLILREAIGWSLLLALLLVGSGIYLVNRVAGAPALESGSPRLSRTR